VSTAQEVLDWDARLNLALEMIDLFESLGSSGGRCLESVLLHANIDESGKFQDKDVICLTGLITSVTNWRGLIEDWSRLLRKHDINFLHIKDLMPWEGIYASKKDTWGTVGRNAVLLEFAALVKFAIGVYRRIRHPMYLALVLYSIGQALVIPNWVAGPSNLIAFAILFPLRVRAEERMMVEAFGDEYATYSARTKRLIPGVW
jgi:Isoprenylcysteine carboxyl methyltransferase (ICMT) family